MIFLWIGIGIVVVGALVYFIEPSLYVLLYSWVLSLFVRNPPYVDVDEMFPDHTKIKAAYPQIKEEMEKLLLKGDLIPKFHEVDGLQKAISGKDDGAWRTFIIKGFNSWHTENMKLVPKTAAVLQDIPQVTLAMFSILDPGKHIPPHVGFYKGVYRYHLALKVPTDGSAYISVGGQEYRWKNGDDVLFDDTYRHFVYNNSQEKRVVFFCDIMREKDLPKWARGLNHSMMKLIQKSPKIQAAAKKAEVPKDILS